jgi:urea carboxylase-associated protein 1
LVTGSQLMSSEGKPMMTIVDTNCPRHDTIGGACSRESNSLRYGHHTAPQHACVDNFLAIGARYGLGKRDLVSNVNWFMNVPVGGDGTLGIVDGLSAPGLRVELRADMDVIVLISNCPQINNPCNGFDPTPVRAIVAAAG